MQFNKTGFKKENTMRNVLLLAVVGTLGFLVACGGGGTPVGVPVSITLTASSSAVNAGGTVNIALSADSSGKGVTWTLANGGTGKLTAVTKTSVTYSAPPTVTSTFTATVTATSIASSSVTAAAQIIVLPAGVANNVMPITVDSAFTNYANGAFADVTICVPASATCQTIDHVLVDTGSFGLRLLASQVTIPLPVLADNSGNTLNNCIQFLDNTFLWGNVAQADIYLAGELASATSVQVIANPTAYSIPSGCTGTNNDTQQTLNANGILGVGPEPFDCGTQCDPNGGLVTPPQVYYLCSTATGCLETFVSCGAVCGDTQANSQITNPVFNFPADNNGVIFELPPVSGTAATITGNLVFGIGTQSNNGLGTATVFTIVSPFDNFTTNFSGQVLNASFIDSGSNALFFPNGIESGFPNGTIPTGSSCQDPFFYCPAASTNFSATNLGTTGPVSAPVNFTVDNADTLFTQDPGNAVFVNLAGPLGFGACSGTNTTACSFDWGLPFFYGRHVFTAINAVTPPAGVPPGPFWAY